MKHKHIYSKDFKYVSSAATDIRKTFERVKKQQKADAEAQEQKVFAIVPVKKAAR